MKALHCSCKQTGGCKYCLPWQSGRKTWWCTHTFKMWFLFCQFTTDHGWHCFEDLWFWYSLWYTNSHDKQQRKCCLDGPWSLWRLVHCLLSWSWNLEGWYTVLWVGSHLNYVLQWRTYHFGVDHIGIGKRVGIGSLSSPYIMKGRDRLLPNLHRYIIHFETWERTD